MKTTVFASIAMLGVTAFTGACGSAPANSNGNTKPAATPSNTAVIATTPAATAPPNSALPGNANNSSVKKTGSVPPSANGKLDPATAAMTDEGSPPSMANANKKKK
jgi:hypothetical protein